MLAGVVAYPGCSPALLPALVPALLQRGGAPISPSPIETQGPQVGKGLGYVDSLATAPPLPRAVRPAAANHCRYYAKSQSLALLAAHACRHGCLLGVAGCFARAVFHAISRPPALPRESNLRTDRTRTSQHSQQPTASHPQPVSKPSHAASQSATKSH